MSADHPDVEGRRRAPAPRSARERGRAAHPPRAWLAVPLILGLLAAGGLAWDRHVHRRPDWCGRIEPTLRAMVEVGSGSTDPDVPADLAAAARAVDFRTLVADLPPDLRRRLSGQDDQWRQLVRNAEALRPGGNLFQVVPFGLAPDLEAIDRRRLHDCEVL